MLEQEFREKVASKIAYYRKESGLTQGQLAEKLNYSDKSVSKWERGDGLPDAFVLYQMSELFGVTINDLTGMEQVEQIPKGSKKLKHIFITILSVMLCWLTAAALFFIMKVTGVFVNISFLTHSWLLFIYAIPASFIVLLVFSCIWYKIPLRLACVSGIIWSVFLSIRLTVGMLAENKVVNYLLIVCIILQVMSVLWFYMKMRFSNNKN